MAIKHLELFAGIGGFRQAFELFSRDFNIPVLSVGYSEIEPNAVKTYKSNFDTSDEIEIGDIVRFVDENDLSRKLPNFDILTGGFPCQSFSMMGKQKGFDDLRGNVFFKIGPIITEKKPKIVLLENVRNIKSHNKGETFQTVINYIKQCGYPYIYHDVFNTSNFGLAQKRNRIFILALRENPGESFKFNEEVVKRAFLELKKNISIEFQTSTLDVLEINVNSKYFLSETIKPTILAHGSKNFKSNSTINSLIAKPLTATMVKMHRACQDNYFSQDFIVSRNLEMASITNTPENNLVKEKIRKLTPKEAFMLQGFSEDFFNKASLTGISDAQLYKQAGNAVSVNTVYAILNYLINAKGLI
ncbi:DNA (cytosine-5-)-methyltransferase [Acholeplasma vituli]|uniref:Cytosine-specific methyltransferase n=1 Tax=Paracholeplasma vituli TaxID=69473 RepID=A0ABT2PVM0_9MOLU|nr:DNA (cytosine-5-)-methyltransferase [Paracholeplasma vituli]MCU0104994.1 DNA (cytosine-5-)-methyltransferase [Paracholeplasma vituli]